MSFRCSRAGLLCGLLVVALQLSTAASDATPRLRALAATASRTERESATSRHQRRKVEESLEVLYIEDDEIEDGTHEEDEQEERNNDEETAVHEGQSMNEDEKSVKSAQQSEESSVVPISQENSAATQTIPSATIAERETEGPLLAEDDSTSLMILNLSLSLATQRFLAMIAAVLGMILTAHQMSENPDGLYAGLCRAILTAIRAVCRIVTCKPCLFGDGRRLSAHRHIPVSTMDYGYKVTDPSVESLQ